MIPGMEYDDQSKADRAMLLSAHKLRGSFHRPSSAAKVCIPPLSAYVTKGCLGSTRKLPLCPFSLHLTINYLLVLNLQQYLPHTPYK